MRLSVEPLGNVPDALVRDHLVRYGLPPEVVEWKYFDRSFNGGRPRGFAWLRGGRVQGSIGMIPFRLRNAHGVVDSAWTCDWSVDSPAENPGAGVMLLKEATTGSEVVVTIGGNEITRRIVPKLSRETLPDAAVELFRPLRLGGYPFVRKVDERIPIGALRDLPVPTRSVSSRNVKRTARVEPGVSPVLAEVLESGGEKDGVSPHYDLNHLQWQLGRCPVVTTATCYMPADRVRTAAVFWRPKSSRDAWRIAVWRDRDDPASLDGVIAEAVAAIGRDGGRHVSVLLSRADRALVDQLKANGFRASGRSDPLYVLGAKSGKTLANVNGLSFLDSDLGYRF